MMQPVDSAFLPRLFPTVSDNHEVVLMTHTSTLDGIWDGVDRNGLAHSVSAPPGRLI